MRCRQERGRPSAGSRTDAASYGDRHCCPKSGRQCKDYQEAAALILILGGRASPDPGWALGAGQDGSLDASRRGRGFRMLEGSIRAARICYEVS